jgi:hypothetical protein
MQKSRTNSSKRSGKVSVLQGGRARIKSLRHDLKFGLVGTRSAQNLFATKKEFKVKSHLLNAFF